MKTLISIAFLVQLVTVAAKLGPHRKLDLSSAGASPKKRPGLGLELEKLIKKAKHSKTKQSGSSSFWPSFGADFDPRVDDNLWPGQVLSTFNDDDDDYDLILNIRHDDYPDEVSHKFYRIFSRNPSTAASRKAPVTKATKQASKRGLTSTASSIFNVTETLYQVEVVDYAGDGTCCGDFGYGWITITSRNDEVIFSARGDYGFVLSVYLWKDEEGNYEVVADTTSRIAPGLAETITPSSDAVETTSSGAEDGRLRGVPLNFVAANPTSLLGLCEGDCDSDSECACDLICYHRFDDDDSIPIECIGEPVAANDYCGCPIGGCASSGCDYSAGGGDSSNSSTSGGSSSTSGGGEDSRIPLNFVGTNPTSMLGRCEGDCDVDLDCACDMICFDRAVSSDPIPSECTGVPEGANDYCGCPAGGCASGCDLSGSSGGHYCELCPTGSVGAPSRVIGSLPSGSRITCQDMEDAYPHLDDKTCKERTEDGSTAYRRAICFCEGFEPECPMCGGDLPENPDVFPDVTFGGEDFSCGDLHFMLLFRTVCPLPSDVEYLIENTCGCP